jgi:hypothetical protein
VVAAVGEVGRGPDVDVPGDDVQERTHDADDFPAGAVRPRRSDGRRIGARDTGALALNRLLSAILYDVSAVEPVVYILSGVVLLVALLAAAALPIARSLRIDPRDAMRSE